MVEKIEINKNSEYGSWEWFVAIGQTLTISLQKASCEVLNNWHILGFDANREGILRNSFQQQKTTISNIRIFASVETS